MSSEICHVTTSIQGRFLVDAPSKEPTLALVGFHGYRSNASQLLQNLVALRGEHPWLLVSVQALSRFYNRSGEVIASWMTKQDREEAIKHNLEYIDKVLSSVVDRYPIVNSKLVFVGFSQGAAMAYRSAAYSGYKSFASIIVGGDVPPELPNTSSITLPKIYLCRGTADSLYPEEQFVKDQTTLSSLSCEYQVIEYQGAHEWNEELYEALRTSLTT